MRCTKCNKVKKFLCEKCNPVMEYLDQYFGKWKWMVVITTILFLIVMASCSAVAPVPSVGGITNIIPSANVPHGTDAGVSASVGSFTWVGAVMMLLGTAGLLSGLAPKKSSITCLCIGIAIAGTPLLLAYVGQTILQWTAGGMALMGLSIVACIAYRRWKRVLNGDGKNT